jgi:hypothetical protein
VREGRRRFACDTKAPLVGLPPTHRLGQTRPITATLRCAHFHDGKEGPSSSDTRHSSYQYRSVDLSVPSREQRLAEADLDPVGTRSKQMSLQPTACPQR